MSILIYYLIIFLLGATTTALGIYFSRKNSKVLKIFNIVLSLTLATVFTIRYMSGQDAIRNMFELGNTPIDGKFLNLVALVLVWLTYSSNLLLSLYGFFKIKALDKFVTLLAFPVSVLNIIFLSLNFTAIMGFDAIYEFSFRGIMFACEIGLALGYSIYILATKVNWKTLFKKKNRTKEKLKAIENYAYSHNKFIKFLQKTWNTIKFFFKNYWPAIFCVIVVVLSCMPAYTMQGLFGHIHQTATCKDFELPHRIILYIGLILPFVIHFSLRNKSFEERKFYLLFICLGTLLSFSLNHKFETFLDPVNWPLHLCNTAMYIMPIVLIFKMKRFFYFTYFINVVGAFFAMFMPNYSTSLNMFDTGLLIFYINHYIAFFMPILFVSLGMFKKPKFKQFVYSMLGFLGYFVLVLILNAWFTGAFAVGRASATTDFFFINSDFIADKLGAWCESLRNVTTELVVDGVTLTFYPVYQTLFFITYIGIGLATWFVYAQGFEISNSFADMKKRKEAINLEKLALESKLNGRSLTEPMNPENSNKLILRNFTKKYGSSNVYAVKDANLEVNGGEIFGFLGPNGAGKSTIIKSIVGIQPITSGEIEVCGYDVDKQSVEAKKQIGFVPDHYALYEKLTGREYINYIADLYDVPLEERTKRINSYVERFELETAFDNQMKTYSHGMKQKIAIMAALVHNPKIWILDEPLTGLDPNSIYQVKECMKEHKQAGNIVFFSSHIIDVVERICDRIAIIKKGNILLTKSVKEIEESGQPLEEFYMSTIKNNTEEEK